MAFTPKQFAVIVAALGVLSFIFGVVAVQKKPQAGESIQGKDVIICKYPSDPSIPLGYLSALCLVASTTLGYFSLTYPYQGKSVPQSAFSNTTFNIFRNIALATSGFAVSLILHTTITGHFLMIRNVHHNLEAECPIAKSGILGGAAFVSLDSSLFWLIVLMLVTNVREDYFDEAKEGDCSKSVTIG
ncbi:hypothetical protein CsSME_00048713 [Camellia sinensis var. sinensis]